MQKPSYKNQHIAMLAVPVLLFNILSIPQNNNVLQTANTLEEAINMDMKKGHKENDAKQTTEAIHSAVVNNDFVAFTKVTANSPVGEVMTKEAFGVLVDKYNAYKDV